MADYLAEWLVQMLSAIGWGGRYVIDILLTRSGVNINSPELGNAGIARVRFIWSLILSLWVLAVGLEFIIR
jgi:hypothetical protein